ncbi:MAG TPA: hypothetical protein VJ865_11345 [Gemmatimonadaceae bacterium]|nr:hypothetical protein [Gemmatimonadaceae bacterium]
MALTATTLAADLAANSTKVVVTSATGFSAGQEMLVDDEYMVIVKVTGTTLEVRSRGNHGTAGKAHDVLAPVVTSSDPADFPSVPVGATAIRPPFFHDVVTYGEDGAIAVPTKDTNVILSKGSAGAYTLAAPSKAQDGLRLTITSKTAFAHVVTATSLIGDGVSGSPHTTATFAAFVGASILLVAVNGVWNEVGTKGVTVT